MKTPVIAYSILVSRDCISSTAIYFNILKIIEDHVWYRAVEHTTQKLACTYHTPSISQGPWPISESISDGVIIDILGMNMYF